MRRLLSAFREWLQLRARVREEYRFHLDCAIADLRGLGQSPRAARRAAKKRLGERRLRKAALREIGGNPGALPHLFCAHRVASSPALQPAVLLIAFGCILLASPSPRLLVESLIDVPLFREPATVVFVSAPAPWPGLTGITPREFAALRSIPGLSGIERYGDDSARAVSHGVSVAAIESEARIRTGNAAIRITSGFDERRILMGPAFTVWFVICLIAFFRLRSRAPLQGRWRWLAQAIAILSLHVLVSSSTWVIATQIWRLIPSAGPATLAVSFAMLFVVWIVAAAFQYRFWLGDLDRRCPVCLERLLLSWHRGAPGDMLLRLPVSESVCAQGHGVLTESRWAREFRREVSPLESLIRA